MSQRELKFDFFGASVEAATSKFHRLISAVFSDFFGASHFDMKLLRIVGTDLAEVASSTIFLLLTGGSSI